MSVADDIEKKQRELARYREDLAISIQEWPDRKTVRLAENRKRNAPRKIATATTELGALVLQNSTVVLLDRTFEGTIDVIRGARASGAIVVDAVELERQIVNNLIKNHDGKVTFNSSNVQRIDLLMSDFLSVNNIVDVEARGLKSSGGSHDPDDAIEIVEKILIDGYGQRLRLNILMNTLNSLISNKLEQGVKSVEFVFVIANSTNYIEQAFLGDFKEKFKEIFINTNIFEKDNSKTKKKVTIKKETDK